MKLGFFTVLGFMILSLMSCRNDFNFEPSSPMSLSFSKDTVYLDTVFTGISSSTYTLKVYNQTNQDISIPMVRLQKGLQSNYRITVDGRVGEQNRVFRDVELLARDSLFIFIEQTSNIIEANPNDFLYTDAILFQHSDMSTQQVELVTLIQDAIFIKPNRDAQTLIRETLQISGFQTDIVGHQLPDELLTWTNQKPYVVYGYALVANNKTLTIEQGTRVHFHDNSGLIVDRLGTIAVNGQLPDYDNDGNVLVERRVQFLGDRLEPNFANVPGQWGLVWLFSEQNNVIEHLVIRNAIVGLLMQPLDVETPYATKLTINNSEIYNCSNLGILSRAGEITATNLGIFNCGQACFAGTLGGSYDFRHCSFINEWFSSSQVSVLLSNYIETQDAVVLRDLIKADFHNSIIFGSNQIQMLLDRLTPNNISTDFNYFFNHCTIRFNNLNNQFTNNLLYDFGNPSLFNQCSIATNSSLFRPVFARTRQHPLRLTESYNLPIDSNFSGFNDLLGISRTSNISRGAYQFVE